MTIPQPTYLIGIPTVLAGKHLVRTVASILGQTIPVLPKSIRIMLDGQDMPQTTLALLPSEIPVKKTAMREGQSAKLADLFATAGTDLIISTNDDVLWAPGTLEKILSRRRASWADIICVGVRPLPPHTMLERILSVGTDIRNEVISRTPGHDTYLVCNGRLVAVSAKIASKLRIPKQIWNNDAYLYFYAKRQGYTVCYIDEPLCAYRDPATFREYMQQTRKFQQSQAENEAYFGPLGKEYAVPTGVRIPALMSVWLRRPFWGSLYVVLYGVTRLAARLFPTPKKHKPYWPIDMSTKELD